MPRNYRIERDATIQRWYGRNSQPRNPRPHRSWIEGSISPDDCFGVPMQVNSPFIPYGYCMVWKYGLNRYGYGILTIDGKQELVHRAVFVQTRGHIPEDKQVNHLCNRPYCVQPSHLYAGTIQDNKDDSQIFTKDELLHAPWILLLSNAPSTDDPLLQRLVFSNRYDDAEPWDPVEQPAQKPLEEFSCPGHDFAITMFGGHSKICRICEVSESQEKEIDEQGAYSLIAEMCPVSQTVMPIFEKIVASEFVGETHREPRNRAYQRSWLGFGIGSHYIRNCSCDYCARDRMAFRSAVQPHLTREESELLDICDRLEPLIGTALEEASADIMRAWAKVLGLNDRQAEILRDHHKDCTNTRSELTRTSRTIEGNLGYLLYAICRFSTREEMVENSSFQQVMLRWSITQVRQRDEEHILGTILPTVEKIANRMTLSWDRETGEFAKLYVESKPKLYQDIAYLAEFLVAKQIMEYLRYELFGRNSFREQEPHPHSHCAASIVESGQVQPFPREFEKGMGYRPMEP